MNDNTDREELEREPPQRVWIQFEHFRSRSILVGEPSLQQRSADDVEYVRAAVAAPQGDALRPQHQCKPLARAVMIEDRDWWIGELLEPVPEWPHETHCLHMKTPLKDVSFLCNAGDFEQLLVLSNVIVNLQNLPWLRASTAGAKVRLQAPFSSTCIECGGSGKTAIGCAVDSALAAPCAACGGTGRKLRTVADYEDKGIPDKETFDRLPTEYHQMPRRHCAVHNREEFKYESLEHELHAVASSSISPSLTPEQWTCFHCDAVLTGREEAEKHFGVSESEIAECLKVRAKIADGLSAEIANWHSRKEALTSVLISYCESNPKWRWEGVEQDPCGAHALLEWILNETWYGFEFPSSAADAIAAIRTAPPSTQPSARVAAKTPDPRALLYTARQLRDDVVYQYLDQSPEPGLFEFLNWLIKQEKDK